METKFVKLSGLVGDTFTVEQITGFNYQKWDSDEKKMLIEHEPTKGYRKVWKVETDKGILNIGDGQLGSLLVASFDPKAGGSQFNESTYKVKSNGKEGIEIRYFFDLVEQDKRQEYGDTQDEFADFGV